MLKDKIINILERKKGTVVTGGQLALTLGVSRNAIWKAIHILQNEGSQIISVPNIGYKLLETNDALSEQLIRANLSTNFVGQNLRILTSVHSTNQHIKELDMSTVENGFTVIADEQVQGRGRRSRPFLSAKGEGVYLSVLFKLNGQQHDIRLLTICAAVAVSKTIERICKVNAEIKWVNDIYCNSKKICGILTEAIISCELQELDAVIIGIGMNTGTIPSEIQEIATSIKKETGMCGIRNELISELLTQLEIVYLDYTIKGKKHDIIQYYESRLFIKGQQVFVSNIDYEYTATVIGIDDAGALIVKNDEDIVHHIATGEIKLKRGQA